MRYSLRKPVAVVFDWDHTLVASPLIYNEDNVKATVSYYRTKMPERVVNAFEEEELGFSLPINRYDLEPCLEGYKMPYSQEVLDYFSNNNVKIGIASNKDRHILQLEVDLIKWRNYFDVVIGRGDTLNKKPAPDMLLLAKREFGIKDEEVWFIGDSRMDTQAGNAAGCTSIHYHYEGAGIEQYLEAVSKYANFHPIGDGEVGAKLSIESLRDLIKLHERSR